MYVKTKELPSVLQRALEALGYGRVDIEVEASETYRPAQISGNGYRAFVCAVNLVTGERKTECGSWGGSNMFSPDNQVDGDMNSYPLPDGFAIIQGREGGSRPVFATILANPANLQKLLPAGNEATLTESECYALHIIKQYKASYRRDAFTRSSYYGRQREARGIVLGEYDRNNPLLIGLAAKGLIKITGAGIQITTEGRNACESTRLPEGCHV